MRLLGLGAMALTLGLGGCMHTMGGDHHDAMMSGGMMGQHDSANCPSADPGAHGAQSESAAQGEHQHQAGASECPPASEAGADQPHQHGEQQPN